MVRYKREILILNAAIDKKLNVIADKAIDTNKEQNAIANE